MDALYEHLIRLRESGDPFIRRITREPDAIKLTVEILDGHQKTYLIRESKESVS